jgi:hypothetical protein
VSLCGLFWGCDRTLALGSDRTRMCHCFGPGKAEEERPDTMGSLVNVDRTRLVDKTLSGTFVFTTELWVSMSPVKGSASLVRGH